MQNLSGRGRGVDNGWGGGELTGDGLNAVAWSKSADDRMMAFWYITIFVYNDEEQAIVVRSRVHVNR